MKNALTHSLAFAVIRFPKSMGSPPPSRGGFSRIQGKAP